MKLFILFFVILSKDIFYLVVECGEDAQKAGLNHVITMFNSIVGHEFVK